MMTTRVTPDTTPGPLEATTEPSMAGTRTLITRSASRSVSQQPGDSSFVHLAERFLSLKIRNACDGHSELASTCLSRWVALEECAVAPFARPQLRSRLYRVACVLVPRTPPRYTAIRADPRAHRQPVPRVQCYVLPSTSLAVLAYHQAGYGCTQAANTLPDAVFAPSEAA